MATKRPLSKLEERLAELTPAQVDPEAGVPLWSDELSLEANLARIKTAALNVFGPDVQCRYLPKKKT